MYIRSIFSHGSIVSHVFFPLRYDVTWKHIWKRPRVCIIYNRRCMCVLVRAYWCSVYSFFLRKNRAVAHTSGTGDGLSDINSRWQDYCFKVIKKKKKSDCSLQREERSAAEIDFFDFLDRGTLFTFRAHILHTFIIICVSVVLQDNLL